MFTTIPKALLDAAASVLASPLDESVKISPAIGYGKDIPKDMQAALQKIMDSSKKNIQGAKFFMSGAAGTNGIFGVSFKIGGAEYVVAIEESRMTKDDGIVMGSIYLQKRGEMKRMLNVVAKDTHDAEFPSDSDITKIVNAIGHISEKSK